MWVPSCSTNQDPCERFGYCVTLPRWQGMAGLLVRYASCFLQCSREPVFSGSLFAVSERTGCICVLCFMCCFWLTACSRQKEPNTINICLRWLLSRISDVKGSKINAGSRKSLSLAFGTHVAVLDSFHMFGNHPEFTGTFNNILSSFLVEGRGYYLSLVVSKHVSGRSERELN